MEYYSASSDQLKSYRIQPLAMINHSGWEYFVAYDLGAEGKEKLFRLDRLGVAVKTESFFDPPENLDLERFRKPDIYKPTSEVKTEILFSKNGNRMHISIERPGFHGLNSYDYTTFNEIQNIETNIHAIAAPLSSKDLEKYCNYVHPTSKNNNISYYQWRTVKKLDYAFNSLDYDPQVVDFEKSNVIRLPNQYRGKRLGHLWSISWVADSIKSKQSSDN